MQSDLKIINARSEGLKKKKILIGMKSLLDNWQMVRDGGNVTFFPALIIMTLKIRVPLKN